MSKTTTAEANHLYLQIAEGLEKMIQDDVLKIGDKLPSVRVLSEEYGISTGTAFQAYYHLEGKGLIESRPKSGYYVRFNQRRFRDLPEVARPDRLSHNVTVKEMIESIYGDIAHNNKKLTNLAMAVPHVSLLPLAKMNKSVQYVLRNRPDQCISYAQTQGDPELRTQLAKVCFNWGGKVKPSEIVVTNGCLEAITISLRVVTQPGDTVAVESPNYFGIFQAIENLGLKAIEIPSHPQTGLDLAYLKRITLKKRPAAIVVIPNFNNPLGGCLSDDRKKELVEFITEQKIPLIEDDIYGELYFGKQRPRTCKTYDRHGWVIHCASLSKSLAPGYRIGWIVPGRFLDPIRQMKRMLSISSPTLTQAAMAHFLQNGRYEYHLKLLRKALHTQCLRYMQSIIQHFPDDTRVSRPAGGFVLWLELNKKVNGFELRTRAQEEHVVIMPGKVFSASGHYDNCIRLSYGKPFDQQAEEGIKTLGRLVHQLAGS